MPRFKSNLLALCSLTLFTLAPLTLSSLAKAQAPTREPDYLRALANLRQAEAWIDASKRPGYKHERKEALKAIDKAIDEVAKAAHKDGENTRHPLAPEMQGNVDAPWRSALKLLSDARHDITQGVDEPAHIKFQEKVVHQIDIARRIIGSTLTVADPR